MTIQGKPAHRQARRRRSRSHSICRIDPNAEDGDISATIVWTSDQQPGSSFTGAAFSTNLQSDGVHVITATVTDALGNVAADSVTITVGP